jgi:hypothetical protein
MLFEFIATLFLLRGLEFIARVVGRRGDVLYYISEPDPHSLGLSFSGLSNSIHKP